jgi:hypothetical protein
MNLETVTDQAGLYRKISEIWHSIPLSHINNYCRTLKPRIWTMEDLNGNSITGRNDMMRIYDVWGIVDRLKARFLSLVRCLDADQVNRWHAMVLDAMKKMASARMNPKGLHEESERTHSLLSGRH